MKSLAIMLLQFICIALLPFKAGALASETSSINWSFYSESYYEDRIEGSVTESRVRLSKPFFKGSLLPFVGLNLSKDLSNGRAPQFVQNAVSPGLGVIFRLPNWFDFLYLYAEKRILFLYDSLASQSQLEEFRSGLYFYKKKKLKREFFWETYGEYIQIDRVSTDSVFSAWSKQGFEKEVVSKLFFSVYLELFTRQTPELGYGPTENEFRLGAKLNWFAPGVSPSLVINYAPLSNVRKDGVDILFILYGGQF